MNNKYYVLGAAMPDVQARAEYFLNAQKILYHIFREPFLGQRMVSYQIKFYVIYDKHDLFLIRMTSLLINNNRPIIIDSEKYPKVYEELTEYKDTIPAGSEASNTSLYNRFISGEFVI